MASLSRIITFSSLLYGLILVYIIDAKPAPGIHHVKGPYVTRIHHYRYKVTTPGDPDSEGNGGSGGEGNGGSSKSSKSKDRVCNRGLINGAADDIRSTVNGGAGKLRNALHSAVGSSGAGGVVNGIGGAADDLFENAFSGVGAGIDDAACGIGAIADTIASHFGKGDIVGGAISAASRAINGVGSVAADLIGHAVNGVGGAIGDFFGGIGNFFG